MVAVQPLATRSVFNSSACIYFIRVYDLSCRLNTMNTRWWSLFSSSNWDVRFRRWRGRAPQKRILWLQSLELFRFYTLLSLQTKSGRLQWENSAIAVTARSFCLSTRAYSHEISDCFESGIIPQGGTLPIKGGKKPCQVEGLFHQCRIQTST